VASPGFTAIVAGEVSGYALDADGGIWAWGNNTNGQLGNGTAGGSVPTPGRVQGAPGTTLPAFAAVAGGSSAAYALDADGGVWAWGYNGTGQLGDGTTSPKYNPVSVVPSTGTQLPVFKAVAAGTQAAYALDEGGGIWAWGGNTYGQLGNGGTSSSATPARVEAATGRTMPKFTAIAAGSFAGYALDVDGGVWAWGEGFFGATGHGTINDAVNPLPLVPAPGTTLPVFTAIAGAPLGGYALDEDGRVWGWGDNSLGELGQGPTGPGRSLTPVRVKDPPGTTLPTFTAIDAGEHTLHALDEDGRVWAWGSDTAGQLGCGFTAGTASYWPVIAEAAAGVTMPALTTISVGFRTVYALDTDGAPWAWGDNQYLQVGDGTGNRTERPIPLPVTVRDVKFGGASASGLLQSGRVWSATTPVGCGQLPVTLSLRFGSVEGFVVDAGVFDFGQRPSFTVQPALGSILAGETSALTVLTDGDPVPSVGWQSRVAGEAWVDIPGASDPTITVQPGVSTEYRAVATSCWSEVDPLEFTEYSDVASVAVTTPSPSPSTPSTSTPSSSTPSSSMPSSAAPSPSQSPQTSKVTAVAMAMKKVTMRTKTSLKAVWLVYPAGAGAKLTWSSSKPKIAKVNTSGKITALKKGRAVITAKAGNGKTARLKVTVVSKAVKAKAIKVAKTIRVKKGKATRLSVQPSPPGATLKKMPTYRSSKSGIAAVDKTGLVTGKKKGRTKITVRLAGKVSSVIVRVT